MIKQVILLTKRDSYSRIAQRIARAAFPYPVSVHEGNVGDPEPAELTGASPDWLISFLSPWIVRKQTLDRCGQAINFHPGPVEYPGTGCYNFALYEEARTYGAVCHHMLPRVDTGKIVMERRFPILSDDSVETLKLRTMETMVGMFRDIVERIVAGERLPVAATHWTREPFTRRRMEALKTIRPTMPPDEVCRRIRATTYPGYPRPYLIREDGARVDFPVPGKAPLA